MSDSHIRLSKCAEHKIADNDTRCDDYRLVLPEDILWEREQYDNPYEFKSLQKGFYEQRVFWTLLPIGGEV